jgi:hypothetical protein
MIEDKFPVAPSSTPEERAEAAQRERDVTDRMFGGDASIVSSYRPALSDSLNILTDAKGWSEAERDAHRLEIGHAFYDARITPNMAPALYSIMAAHAVTPADDATVNSGRWSAADFCVNAMELRKVTGDSRSRPSSSRIARSYPSFWQARVWAIIRRSSRRSPKRHTTCA